MTILTKEKQGVYYIVVPSEGLCMAEKTLLLIEDFMKWNDVRFSEGDDGATGFVKSFLTSAMRDKILFRLEKMNKEFFKETVK